MQDRKLARVLGFGVRFVFPKSQWVSHRMWKDQRQKIDQGHSSTMTNGVLLFANNNEQVDYVKQAVYSAKLIKQNLGCEVAIASDCSDYVRNGFSKYSVSFFRISYNLANRNKLGCTLWLAGEHRFSTIKSIYTEYIISYNFKKF